MDHKDFGKAKGTPEQTSVRWWVADEADLASSVLGTVKRVKESQAMLENQRQVSARLYGNLPWTGVNGQWVQRNTSTQVGLRDRLTYNVIASVIDTVCAKIAKNRPKPLFLTSGGDWATQRKAKKLTRFCEGVFEACGTRKMSPIAFRDACVFGDGLTHVFADKGRIVHERVLASELYVDDQDGFYGSPRQMHRATLIDREVLKGAFQAKADEIERASNLAASQAGGALLVADSVPIVESWHLPSYKGAKDGRHSIVIADCVLLDESWERTEFPFAKLPWSPRLFGYWAQGLAEQLQNIQMEINKLLWTIQRSMHLAGTQKIAIEMGAKVSTEHINNEIGAIIRYSEKPPLYLTPPIVQPEIYQHLETLKRAAYEQAGISQLSASAQKPAGLDSGKALREYNDIESDRFTIVGQAFETYHLDLARLSIAAAREAAAKGQPVEVKAPGAKAADVIKWSEVDLPDDAFVMQVYPVSSLPTDPAGRLQTVQEYVQAGFYDAATAKRLLDFPDLAQVDSLDGASEERIIQALEGIVDRGEYTPPDPFMDLRSARRLALQFYNLGAAQKLEEERIELLEKFLTQIDTLMASAAPPPAAAGPAQPLAAPMPTPTSDLIPNAAGMPS